MSDLLSTPPFILPYHGILPVMPDLRHAGARSAVIGRVTLGPRASIGALALLRADGHVVEIGADFFIGDRGTVHIAHELYPALVGDRVTVGRNGVVHACTVGSDCVIEENAVILDGSVVEDGVILEAGAVAFPRSKLEANMVYAGIPAKPVRPVEPGEIARRAARLRAVPDEALAPARAPARLEIDPSTFIAATSTVAGTFRAGARSSVLFSCELDAGDSEIVLGANSNIQDNTIIRCVNGPFVMAADAVIGHNVMLENCTIGTGVLVGMGSQVAAGTVFEPDVLLAAGARTESGQVLESGWLWGGSPARKISPMDERKRAMIPWIIGTYCEYTAGFLTSQNSLRSVPA